MFAEYVPFNDAGLLRLCNVIHAGGQNGIAIVGPAVFGKETDETLSGVLVLGSGRNHNLVMVWRLVWLTEKAGIAQLNVIQRLEVSMILPNSARSHKYRRT